MPCNVVILTKSTISDQYFHPRRFVYFCCRWVNIFSSCSILLFLDCGNPLPDLNRRDDTSNGTVYLSTVTFSCNDGYELVGENISVCTALSKWRPEVPYCKIKGDNVHLKRSTMYYWHSIYRKQIRLFKIYVSIHNLYLKKKRIEFLFETNYHPELIWQIIR